VLLHYFHDDHGAFHFDLYRNNLYLPYFITTVSCFKWIYHIYLCRSHFKDWQPR
jgi:hypothetical protein